ncbi:MAG: class I SAM-dependent methyltransferase [Pseudomonadota bacterium]
MVYKGERFVDPKEAEQERLRGFEARGGLEGPVYALSPGMADFDVSSMVAAHQKFGADLDQLKTPGGNETGYKSQNGYFETPDTDILYLMVRAHAPKRVIEVGCGNSTRITRQAIMDGGLTTTLSAIDPFPRAEMAHLVDRFEQTTLEAADHSAFDDLQAGDMLFIDSSHQVRMSNDVAHLFCRILPELRAGVIVHVHDVFLPWEYPKRFFYDCPGWGEQYVLHAALQGGGWDVLWPGFYLQQGRPELAGALPFMDAGRAQSFWMRKR